ncbi:MAG: hypothetical protein Tsb0013_07930 [Phycisphaerales bacterium]
MLTQDSVRTDATRAPMIGTASVLVPMPISRLIPIVLAFACVLLTTERSHAQPAAEYESRIERALACVPADADLCLAISHARALRQTLPGRFVEDAIETFSEDDDGALQRVLSAFGLDPGTAFDSLFGREVILVIRTGDDGRRAWAVRSEVSIKTLRTLRRALSPSPRDVVGGQPIFAVENGRFSLAIDRTNFGATITLAPASNDTLLRAMLDVQPSDGLLGRDVFPFSGKSLTDADALLYVDLTRFASPGMTPDEPMQGPTWIALSAEAQDAGIGIAARITAPDIAGPAGMPFRPWATSWFEDLQGDALLVMLDRTNNEVLEALLGDPERGTPGLLPWTLPVEVSALATHRAAAIIREGSGGTLEAALALETDDVRALADAIDGALPTLVDPDAVLFNGVPISAMRTASVPAPAPLLSKDGSANLAWTFRVCSDCNENQQTGWWSVGLGASTVSRLGRTLVADPEPTTQDHLPWLGMGVVRPAKLLDTISRAGLALGPEGRLLARIDELRWHEIRTGSDSSIAALTITLTPEGTRDTGPVTRTIAGERPAR